MAPQTVGDLRASLISAKAQWAPPEHLADDAKLPEYALGIPEGFPTVDKLPAADLKKILAEGPANPLLAAPRARIGVLPKAHLRVLDGETKAEVSQILKQPKAPGRTAVVDWRNRYGTSWVDQVRDQNPCGNCWAFAVTAVVESMVRIDHCVWCIRSEGDLRDGWGKTCADGAWPQDALDWIKAHGIADPRCYPFYHGNHPYNPTPDRNGRTVRIDSWNWLTTADAAKNWLYAVGPTTCVFEVYNDFFGYGTGVYHKSAGAQYAGLHSVEVIGYDDTLNCWICKNSWGPSWGDHGYFKIGYGECKIDDYGKIGVPYTDPDPVTKRRLHNGNLLESGYGPTWHRNFEMVATSGTQAKHWWRDNSTAGFPWHPGPVFGNDVAVCPTLTETSYNRNLEIVYLTTGGRLHHWWRDENTGIWHDGGIFGPLDAAGVPGFIQGSYNAPGNFEVVVRTADGKLNHWWRDGGGWHDGGRFGANVAYSGASLVQSTYGVNGNLELVAVCGLTRQMQHYWRDDDHGFVWHPGACFGSNVTSPPCMIQGQYGMGSEFAMGNFELCVAVGGQVQHWWRNNAAGQGWSHSATFGHDVLAVAGLLEGSFGFNLEVIVLRTDNKLQHYWRAGGTWYEGVVIGAA